MRNENKQQQSFAPEQCEIDVNQKPEPPQPLHPQ